MSHPRLTDTEYAAADDCARLSDRLKGDANYRERVSAERGWNLIDPNSPALEHAAKYASSLGVAIPDHQLRWIIETFLDVAGISAVPQSAEPKTSRNT